MRIYLASPNTQQQAEHVADMPVLLSFASYAKWLDRYQPSFDHILCDSGAYSEMTTGKKVDIGAYRDWGDRYAPHADARAGLDDIQGDWQRSLANYAAIPWGFPTFHDSDPPELLDELIPIARERGRWIGIGLVPPRDGKERFMRATCDRIPDDLHIHGWACRTYTHIRRLDSVDSTNWWRDAMKIRRDLPWLTYGECLAIIVKRYQRWERIMRDDTALSLWDEDSLT